MSEWRLYRSKWVFEARPYVPGERISGTIMGTYGLEPKAGDMIARLIEHPGDTFLVKASEFESKYEEVKACVSDEVDLSPSKFDPGSFEWWWWSVGSGMRPEGSDDLEGFIHRMARIAWEKGVESVKAGGEE